LPEIVQEIGAAAGLAAVVGLAVLSALYFSQARDVKRLREWAGRAPERSEAGAPPVPGRVVAQPQTPQPASAGPPAVPVPRPATAAPAVAASATGAGPATAQQNKPAGVPVPATAAATAAQAAGAAGVAAKPGGAAQPGQEGAKPNGEGTKPDGEGAKPEGDAGKPDGEGAKPADGGPAKPPAAQAAGAQASAVSPASAPPRATEPTGASPAPASPAGARPVTPAGASGPAPAAPPPVRRSPTPQRPVVRPGASRPAPQETVIIPPRRSEPWYRRIGTRYVAIVLVGVLVLGGAAAYGVTQLTGDDSGDSPRAAQADGTGKNGSGKPKRNGAAINPASVTVAVLNGTTVPGLAATLSDQVGAAGFKVGTITNFYDQQLAESVVQYAPGHEAEAKAVSRRTGITQREPVNPSSRALAGDATVIVIAGADKAP
jgi:hypothetical protein